MDIRDIKNRKKQLGLTNKQLADYSGVSLGTVNKILSGATKSPQIDTLDALDRALQRKEFRYHTESEPVLCIREESIAYDTMKKDGECAIVVKGTDPLFETKCRMEATSFVKLLCRKHNPYDPKKSRRKRKKMSRKLVTTLALGIVFLVVGSILHG